MKLTIYLIPTPRPSSRHHDRFYPYFEQNCPPTSSSDRPEPEAAPSPGGIKVKIVNAYRTLKEQLPLHERLCAAMAGEHLVEILHPDSISTEEARRCFRHFLILRLSKHKLWFGVNGLLAGLGAPLFFLPGPNFFFYYPAVRALGHYRALTGARKATDRKTRYIPNSHLGQFLQAMHGKQLHEIAPLVDKLAGELGLARLPDFFRKHLLSR